MKARSSLTPWVAAVVVSAGVAAGAAQTPTTKPKPASPPIVGGASATPPPDPLAGKPAAANPTKPSPLDAKMHQIFALQVALDRAGFSSGEIDARAGSNTARALRAFQESKGLPATDAKGTLDSRTSESLGDAFANPLATYAITDEDLAGPFVNRVPADMMEKAQLPALAYASIEELLGERFHVNPQLLRRLNPNARFAGGDVISVPNVEAFNAPAAKPARQEKEKETGSLTVTVTDATKTLTVQNASGETLFHAPVTTGSANDPLPVGEWKVNGVSRNPTFNYNPDLFWDANPSHAKAKLAPGPNNPVGVVWIDLSKEHYGIHGTPEPSRIGHTESHGCIRLTNWDATKLASMVAPGTKVTLR